MNKYLDLECKRHEFHLLGNYKERKWGLVFVDLITWELRKEAILKYKNADYVVIHDSERMFANVFTKKEFSELFKYWKEFTELYPNTVAASNKFEI